MFKRALILFCLTLLSAVLGPSRRPNQERNISSPLRAPVRLPKQGSEPGKAIFQLLDPPLRVGTYTLARR